MTECQHRSGCEKEAVETIEAGGEKISLCEEHLIEFQYKAKKRIKENAIPRAFNELKREGLPEGALD